MSSATPRRAFVSLVLDCTDAPAHGGDSIVVGDKTIGTVTSADWGHRVGKNIAMGFVDPADAGLGTQLLVDVIGEPVPAEVADGGLYDPDNRLVRQ